MKRAVLKYDEKNAKALYKMCQSHEVLDTTFDLEQALKYIIRAKEIAPENKAILHKYNNLKQTLKTQNQKDRKQFHGLFNRGSLYDDKQNMTEKANMSTDPISVVRRCFDRTLSHCIIL